MSSTATASRSQRRITVGSESWLACARSRSLVSSVTGQRIGHLAHVLDEENVAEVLEKVDHEPAQILPLLRELLEELQSPGGIPVDDEVAEAEEGLFLDRSEQMKHLLDGDRAVRSGGELIERRDRVAEAASRTAGDQRQRRLGRLDPLALRNSRE